MPGPETNGYPLLEWAVAAAPKHGEVESGDRYVVLDEPDGALVAVVDGLGHGRPAAVAAQRAVEVLVSHRPNATVPQLIRSCHDALVETRGVVMSLARFNATANTVTWLGVGNVDGHLVRKERRDTVELLVRNGIVGAHLPTLRTTTAPLAVGDLLLMTTDGIDPSHDKLRGARGDPANLAGLILSTYGTGADDALVLVARYRRWKPVPVR